MTLKKDEQLRAYWSPREQDMMFHHPAGPQTGADGHMLYGALYHDRLIGGRTLIEELKARGYDVRTLKFSVEKEPTHKRWATPADSASEPSSDAKETKR